MARVVHFEIPVEDHERARAFYAGAFDWDLAGGADTPYLLATTGSSGEPGIDGALITRSSLHAAPVLVVDVADLHEGLRRAEEAGATVLLARHAVPGVGWSAYVRDPEGNVLGLWQSDDEAA